MQPDLFRDLAAGATLITVNTRLARVFARDFHAGQRDLGHSVWRPPDILPLDAFLRRAWSQCVWRGVSGGATLRTPLQELIAWEQVIRASPEGDSLLQIPETAQSAGDTWKLVQAYRLPVDGRFEASDDWEAFAAWSREFDQRCRANHWLDQARLGDFIARRFSEGKLPRPSPLYVAGFDQLTPQQSGLFAALGSPQPVDPPRFDPARACFRFEDTIAEIRAAAAWSRQLLERAPDALIGVIVPDLARLRVKVERIFREVLHPAAALPASDRSFHLSLGPPLADAPLVHAAFLILEFARAGLSLPRAGVLLRSPFLGGFESEGTRRGLLDARLRRMGVWDLDASGLRSEASGCPVLLRNLGRIHKLQKALPAEQPPSQWSRDFTKLLEALGWPGDRTLDSREYQVVQAWRDLLSNLGTLDLALPHLTFDQALSRLHALADSQPFQIENQGAPIQILGMLEASGLSFDHLWIMGLHDEALPSSSAPNPFLPVSLQREYKLPHSSAERELEFARSLLARFLASAPDVVLSYPASESDRGLTPSPLIEGPWSTPPREAHPIDEWVAQMRAGVVFEEIADEYAPPVAPGSEQRGGVSILKDMAACPFRAFAKHRLAARPLEEATPGLNYRDRGNTVHQALQVIWSELGSHARLLALSPAELRELIARASTAAIDRIPHAIGRALEQRRLEKLLWDWLELEKSRDPFTVRGIETESMVTIGGLEVKTRADRVDQLASGRDIILDYKTGKLNAKGWDTDRPDEPQLPLYSATSDRPVAAAAFAQIRVGYLYFQGLSESGASLPGMKKMRMEQPVPFDQQLARWHQALEKLGRNFRDGRAEVDPKNNGSCEHCGLWALCRIREVQVDER